MRIAYGITHYAIRFYGLSGEMYKAYPPESSSLSRIWGQAKDIGSDWLATIVLTSEFVKVQATPVPKTALRSQTRMMSG